MSQTVSQPAAESSDREWMRRYPHPMPWHAGFDDYQAFCREIGLLNVRYSDLSLWLNSHGSLLVAALPPDHPALDAFRNIAFGFGDEEPSLASLMNAWRVLRDLPEAEQRLAFGGWSPYFGGGGTLKSHLVLPVDPWNYMPRRVLKLVSDGAGEVEAFHVAEQWTDLDAVRVEIRDGTSREQVLAALENFTAAVKAAWSTLIDTEEVNPGLTVEVEPAREKGDRSNGPDGSMPASLENRKARESTAA